MSVEAVSALERGFRRAPQRRTVDLLAEALGLRPDEAVRFAAAAGAAATPVPRRRVPAPALAAPPNLRGGVAHLLGRDADVTMVAGLVKGGRLVTICGAGGIGKTELALAVARDRYASSAFKDARFVSLAALPSHASPDDTIALAFGLPAGTRPAELVEALAERCALLIVDNCEHIAERTAALLRRFLEACPDLAVLATSRQPLGLAGEDVYPLAPLDIPAAVELFAERARQTDARFVLTDALRPIVTDICSQLDGIALAVEIAARRTRVLDPAEIRARLERRFRLLVDDAAVEPRQRTVAALIAWSYDLLSPTERRFFDRLSVFASSFTLEAACAVALDDGEDDFDALDTLESLIAKSLVVRGTSRAGETPYALLETLRAFGAERLAAGGDRALVERRLVRYVDGLFAAAGVAYEQEARVATLARLDVESRTFTAALDVADRLGLVLEAARLFARIPALRRWLGDDDIVARSARYIEALEHRDEPLLSAYLWIRHGNALSRLDAPRSLPAFERALDCARRVGDPAALGRALVAIALGTMRLRRFDDARRALAEAATLEISTEARKEHRHTCALLALYSGDLETAVREFAAIADAERSLGNDGFEFDALHVLAEAHAARGAFAEARAAAALAEPLYPAVGPHARASFRSSLAAYACFTGHAAPALRYATEAIEIRPRDNVWPHAVRHAALALALGGDVETAAVLDGFAAERIRESAFEGFATERAARERLECLLTGSLDPGTRRTLALHGARLTGDAARDVVRSNTSAAAHDASTAERFAV